MALFDQNASYLVVLAKERNAEIVNMTALALSQADACVTDVAHRKSVQELLTKYLSPTYRKVDPEEEAREAAIDEWALKPTRKWIYRNHRQTILCSASIPQRRVSFMPLLNFEEVGISPCMECVCVRVC